MRHTEFHSQSPAVSLMNFLHKHSNHLNVCRNCLKNVLPGVGVKYQTDASSKYLHAGKAREDQSFILTLSKLTNPRPPLRDTCQAGPKAKPAIS